MGYLNYIERPQTGKTKVFAVHSNGCGLGLVKWYAPWRRYCFYPNNDTIFDKGCMNEVIQFIDGLMEGRKTERLENLGREQLLKEGDGTLQDTYAPYL